MRHLPSRLSAMLTQHDGITGVVRKVAAIHRKEGMAGLGLRVRWLFSAPSRAIGTVRNISYAEWIDEFAPPDPEYLDTLTRSIPEWHFKPLVSVVVPVYNPDISWFLQAVDSLRAQIYPHWELCLADDASTDPAVRPMLEQLARDDARIRVVLRPTNGHISAATNSAIGIARGGYIGLLDQDDLLSPDALFWMVERLQQSPRPRLLFSDEDKFSTIGKRFGPYFKSDFNHELMLGQNMVSHFGVYETALVRSLGGCRPGFEGSQDYDLALRVIDSITPSEIAHVPRVLYHWRVHRQSTSSGGDAKPYALVAAERAVREHLQRRGEHAEVCADPQTLSCEVRFALPDPPPMVSVIVFSDANTAPACMASISQKADYPAFEVIQCHGPSRHAAIHRAVAEQARGQIVVLLDANADITHPDWMRHLVSHAVRPQIGAVGGKVLDGRGRLLHAGLVLGMGRGAGPVHQGLEPTEQGYFGRAALAQNFSALASTCLAIRRDVFLQAGGFDNTAFSGLLADADFCLRVGELGLRHVWTPLSVVALRDQRSQGSADDAQTGDAPPLQGPDAARIETARFARRWGHLLLSDPYYSPNLTLEGGHFQTGFPSRVPSLPPPTLPATCRFGLVIPSRDAGLLWDKVLAGILAQQLIRPQVLIVDSGSRDGTVEIAREHGLEVLQIDPESFSHGGTRQMALERLDCDVVFFLTHDAVLASPFSLALLAQALDDPKVAVAYGRQLPFAHARLNGRILRHFNYPRWSEQRSFADRERLGIRCAFNSNSFAAYRVQALRAVGGFDPDIPVGEDFVACAALLQAGHQSAYVAHATVLHSHDYTLAEEVSRYRLIGRMHRMRWDLIQTFGRAEREGWVLVRRELAEVMRREPLGLPLSVLRIAARYLGYRSGLSG